MYVMKGVVHVMKRVVYVMEGVVRVTSPLIYNHLQIVYFFKIFLGFDIKWFINSIIKKMVL